MNIGVQEEFKNNMVATEFVATIYLFIKTLKQCIKILSFTYNINVNGRRCFIC